MTPANSQLRPQRRQVFFGCEGQSEQSYGKLLHQLLDKQSHDFIIDVHRLRPTGGNPLMLVNSARELIQRQEFRDGFAYIVRALLLDFDTTERFPKQYFESKQIAQANELILIWQNPCHEAFLLRHLEGCMNMRPKTNHEAEAKLRRQWPSYEKGMSTIRLSDYITLDCILRAAKVENDLATFLAKLDLSRSSS